MKAARQPASPPASPPARSAAKPTPPKKPAAGPVRKRRWVRWLLAVAVLAVVAPPIQAGLLNLVDPPLTWTMVSRALRHGWKTGDWQLPAHTSVSLQSLPRHVPVAAVSSEDRSFLHHEGFDLVAIRRAWHRYRTRPDAKLVGGSTISQQVARNAFLWQHRSWLRKGLEAYYTVWLELLVPKERILEVYLNVAELGPMVFGVEAAARHWYGKPAAQLKPNESARLVALLPAPNTWTPRTPHVERRAAWILRNPVRLPLSGR